MNREEGWAMRRRRGVTLVELMVAMLASSVLLLAVVGVMAGSQKQWNQTYDRVFGDIVTEAYTTRQVFDREVRESSSYSRHLPDDVRTYIILYQYTNIQNMGTDPPMNRYAWFRLSGTNLLLQQGPLSFASGSMPTPGPADSTQTLAHHVTSARFWRTGPCIHMALVLSDGQITLPVAMTATRNNP
jgi:prepilin-type N-terminal cleavage/methylation domain-containing protein